MYGNPYYNQIQRFQGVEPMNQYNQHINTQPFMQPIQPMQTTNTTNLLGKSVDSIDVVKAMDIPLDGSTSYFPLTDGSAIVTKKLQSDGTSKTVVYKPIEKKEDKKEEKYITISDLEEKLDKLSNDGMIEELSVIKKDLLEIKNSLKERKK